MKSETADRWLRALFFLNALLLMSALFAVFLPARWMASIHEMLGLGAMPTDSIALYLARSCSLLYGIHGIVLLVVARNLRKYQSLIPVLVGLHAVLGCFMLGIDVTADMPWYWTAMEGPGILGFAILLMFLYSKSSYRRSESN